MMRASQIKNIDSLGALSNSLEWTSLEISSICDRSGYVAGAPATVPRALNSPTSLSSGDSLSRGRVIALTAAPEDRSARSMNDDSTENSVPPPIKGYIRLRKPADSMNKEEDDSKLISFVPIQRGKPPPRATLVKNIKHKKKKGQSKEVSGSEKRITEFEVENVRADRPMRGQLAPDVVPYDINDFEDSAVVLSLETAGSQNVAAPDQFNAEQWQVPMTVPAFSKSKDPLLNSLTPLQYIKKLRKFNSSLNPLQRVQAIESTLRISLDTAVCKHASNDVRLIELTTTLDNVGDDAASMESGSTLSTAEIRAAALKKMRMATKQTAGQRRRAMLNAERSHGTRVLPVIPHGRNIEAFHLRKTGKTSPFSPDKRPDSVPISPLPLYSPRSFRMPAYFVKDLKDEADAEAAARDDDDDDDDSGEYENDEEGIDGERVEGIARVEGVEVDQGGGLLEAEWGFADDLAVGYSLGQESLDGSFAGLVVGEVQSVAGSIAAAASPRFNASASSRDGQRFDPLASGGSREGSRGQVRIPIVGWDEGDAEVDETVAAAAVSTASVDKSVILTVHPQGSVHTQGSAHAELNENYSPRAGLSGESQGSRGSQHTKGLFEDHASLLRSQLISPEHPSPSSSARYWRSDDVLGMDGPEGYGLEAHGNAQHGHETQSPKKRKKKRQPQPQQQDEQMSEEELEILHNPWAIFGHNLDRETASYRGYKFPRDGKLDEKFTNLYIRYRDYPHDPLQLSPQGNFVAFDPIKDRPTSPNAGMTGTPYSQSPRPLSPIGGRGTLQEYSDFPGMVDRNGCRAVPPEYEESKKGMNLDLQPDLTVPAVSYEKLLYEAMLAGRGRRDAKEGNSVSVAPSVRSGESIGGSSEQSSSKGVSLKSFPKIEIGDLAVPASQRQRLLFEARLKAKIIATQIAQEDALKAAIRKEEEEWKILKKQGQKRPPRRRPKSDGEPGKCNTVPPAYTIIPLSDGTAKSIISSSLKPPKNATFLKGISKEVPMESICRESGAIDRVEEPNIESFNGISVYIKENFVDETPPKTPAFVQRVLEREERMAAVQAAKAAGKKR